MVIVVNIPVAVLLVWRLIRWSSKVVAKQKELVTYGETA